MKLSNLYFKAKTLDKQINYLASLICNIYEYYEREITHFHLVEETSATTLNDDSQKQVGKLVRQYFSENDQVDENSHVRMPDIICNSIKIEDFINMKY